MDILIQPDELASRLSDPNVVILDATVILAREGNRSIAKPGREAFDESHIPGAQFLDATVDVSKTDSPYNFTIADAEQLESAARRFGVNDDTLVVFYSTSHIMWATRGWWVFHYAGHDNVRVLDGGFDGWQTAGHATTAEVTARSPGNFNAKLRPGVFADKNEVLAASTEGGCVINALTAASHRGEGFNYGRAGHITGSTNLPFDEIVIDGRFAPADDLRSALSRHGSPDTRVITYCGGGIAATVDAVACLMTGYSDVAVYDGSLSEWTSDPEAPMSTGD